jgi:predicted homoserine dehydrogenase-like protein
LIYKLKQLHAEGGRIGVAVVGCGAMGIGVAWQVARTPGMDIVVVADISEERAAAAALKTGRRPVRVTQASKIPSRKPDEEVYVVVGPTEFILESLTNMRFDALAECSNRIYEAYLYCQAAIAQGAHVVLMNAEVDLVLGTTLAHQAARKGVCVTSDAGDQHGVLATMADEIELWGFRLVQLGNMKGFLNRYATAASAQEWADKQKLSVVQTVSYTDGTKMNIEQAIIGNYKGLTPFQPGMEGPKIKDLRQVFDAGVFSLDQYGEQGRIDYTEGVPWPGGGVYAIGHCDDDQQDFLLNYYKVTSKRPYYLFFRPYHLCHVETPRAIAQCYFDKRPVISPPLGLKKNDVYAYAKSDVKAGTVVHHAIGGDELYGMVDAAGIAAPADHVPIAWFEALEGKHAVLRNSLKKDQPVTWADVDFPSTAYHELLRSQDVLAKQSAKA